MTPADLAAVVADWCEAHGVSRVDVAIALLGAEVPENTPQESSWEVWGEAYENGRLDGGREMVAQAYWVGMPATFPTPTWRSVATARAAALAVAAMRCDLEGR